MKTFDEVLFQELELSQLKIPSLLIKPLQVHVLEDGIHFGRFTLSDVFEGKFDTIAIGEPAKVAKLNGVLSKDYDFEVGATMTGLQSYVAKLQGTASTKNVRKINISAVEALLQEAEQGALHSALASAKVKENSPLIGRQCVVVVGVASAKSFEIGLSSQLGGKIEANAEAVADLGATGKFAASISSDGGIKFEAAEEAIPFAVKLWAVKKSLFGADLKITSVRGPVGVLGPKSGGSEFEESAGISPNVVDFGAQ